MLTGAALATVSSKLKACRDTLSTVKDAQDARVLTRNLVQLTKNIATIHRTTLTMEKKKQFDAEQKIVEEKKAAEKILQEKKVKEKAALEEQRRISTLEGEEKAKALKNIMEKQKRVDKATAEKKKTEEKKKAHKQKLDAAQEEYKSTCDQSKLAATTMLESIMDFRCMSWMVFFECCKQEHKYKNQVKLILIDPPYASRNRISKREYDDFAKMTDYFLSPDGVVVMFIPWQGAAEARQGLMKNKKIKVDPSLFVLVRDSRFTFRTPNIGFKNVVEYALVAYVTPIEMAKVSDKPKYSKSHKSAYQNHPLRQNVTELNRVCSNNSGFGWEANVFLDYRPPSWKLMDTTVDPPVPIRRNAEKSTSLMTRLLVAYTSMGDYVMDCFAGTAVTCLASIAQDRNWIGCEKDAKCHKLAKERIINEVRIYILSNIQKYWNMRPYFLNTFTYLTSSYYLFTYAFDIFQI
jgi:16S rRNA G966 N2-methylase RsmD